MDAAIGDCSRDVPDIWVANSLQFGRRAVYELHIPGLLSVLIRTVVSNSFF